MFTWYHYKRVLFVEDMITKLQTSIHQVLQNTIDGLRPGQSSQASRFLERVICGCHL